MAKQNIYKSVFVIIGTLIGAGFASGQEIYVFFNRYDIKGIFGLVLSISLISIIIYKTLKIIINRNINTYEDFLENIIPKKFNKSNILKNVIKNIINIFLLISFNIMVAGFSTYFLQELNMSKWLGSIIIASLCLITFSKSIDGVAKINEILIPILIFMIVFLGLNKTSGIAITKINNYSKSLYWIISSILYASYNSITLIPILISLKKYVSNNNETKKITIITAILILLLSITIFLLINLFIEDILNIEIPILYIAGTIGNAAKYIYGIVVLIAIFTTAISSGYSFLNNVSTTRNKYMTLSIIICACSLFIGQFEFSNLINLLYPIFGYLGIVQIIFIIIA